MSFVAARYFLPEGTEIPFVDDGFMPDPSDEWSRYWVPTVRSLEALAELPCAIVIGEPGLGKTTAMRAEFVRMREVVAGTGDRVHWVGLGSTRESSVLERKIFSSEAVREWRAGEGRLYLFLDALDEARLRIARVADLILEGLEGAPFDRLTLRLSCRSANRHKGLEAQLRERFGEDGFEVRELAPLTKRDAAAAATARGLDPGTILKSIIARGLQPLAMIPESLNFLLDVAASEGDVPDSRAEAYEGGLLLLAGEPDEDRLDSDTAGALGPSARLALCARIAAGLVLSGRTSVRTAKGEPGPDEALLSHLAGGQEVDRTLAVPQAVEATPEALTEALGTAMFTSHGQSGRGLRQASYSEYLCARWLAGGALSRDQLEDLLFVETGQQLRIVPQLHELASWLADQDKEFFDRLLDTDPTVLLRADPSRLDAAGRRRVVAGLIAGAGSFEVDRWDRRVRATYPLLAHPGIAEQLSSVILNPGAEGVARQVACDVAGACALTELEDDLADLALDSSVDLQVRLSALLALDQYASDATRVRLQPLATRPLEEDEDDELKGGALSATWPTVLSASELFAALTNPKRRNLYGQYKAFLVNELVQRLDPRDLSVALAWAAELPVHHYPTDALSDVRERLLIEAWPKLAADGRLVDAYTAVVAGLLRKHADLLDNMARRDHPEVFGDPEGRRLIVERLVPSLMSGALSVSQIILSTPRLIDTGDVRWLLERVGVTVGSPDEEAWAQLAQAVVSLGGDDDAVMEALGTSPHLDRLMLPRYAPVRLGSEEARAAREQYEEWNRLTRLDEEPPVRLDIAGNTRAALEQFEAGDDAGFWIATKWLEIDPDDNQRKLFVSDLTSLPGWELLDGSERRRLVAAALRYLQLEPPDPRTWFASRTINWPAWAGYRALRLVCEQAPNGRDRLDPGVWSRWAPIIVDWPVNGGEGEEHKFNDWAIERLVRAAPEEAARWFGCRLDADLRGGGSPFVLHRFRRVWHPLLEQELLTRARRSRLEPAQRTTLLEALLRHGSAAAREHASRLVTPPALAGSEKRRALAVQVGALLVAEHPAVEWHRIWRLMLQDDGFGRQLIERLATDRERQIAGEISPHEAADLYAWLLERFPYESDPRVDEAHFISAREQIGRWRDGVLNALVASGSREAVQAIGSLAAANPQLAFLRRLRREAELIVQQSEWVPPAPQHVVRMAHETSYRHIRSAADLRRVALGSLARAQTRLQGLRPAIYDLWDTGTVRPKRERLIAAWLERHLREDLADREIIVGREVELRAHPKGRMGSAVDILITAFARPEIGNAPEVALSLELKCCWHADLDTAMRDQLVASYLDPELTQGIYLVAYFDAPHWDTSDRAYRTACRRRSLEQSRQVFAAQATEINQDDIVEVSAFVLDCRLPGSSTA